MPSAEQYLKPGITFAELDKIAYAMSDTVYAELMDKAQYKLKGKIHTSVQNRELRFS